MRHISKTSLLLLVVSMFFSLAVYGQDVPKLMNFQGVLEDQATGDPVADGTYSLRFSIYDTPTGTTALWAETQNVEVTGGNIERRPGE